MSTPYTYLIGWSDLDKWYYGVRYSKSAHPDDLWVTYFTSSKYVKDFVSEFGSPDVIQIRKIFNNPQKARIWESTVLKRINAVASDKFLNKSYSDGSFCASREHLTKLAENNRGKTLSPEHRQKLSAVRKGKPKSAKHSKAIALSLTGKVRPEAVRQKIGDTRRARGIKSSTSHMNETLYHCKACDKTMTKGNFVRWHSSH
jgi:hypothetical protein